MKEITFRDLAPCNLLKVSRRFGVTSFLLSTRYHGDVFQGFFLAMKMEAIQSSKMSVVFPRTTWSCNPDDGNIHALISQNTVLLHRVSLITFILFRLVYLSVNL
jgi:hypothetical protein